MERRVVLSLLLQVLCLASVESECPSTHLQLHCSCETSNEVRCVGANLTSLPRDIPHATTTLDLASNLITHVTYTHLTSLRNMVALILRENRVTSIGDGSFQAMEHLQTLDVSHNEVGAITEQTLYGLDSLSNLDLSHNLLRYIDGAFVGLTTLTRLDLSHNQVERVTQLTFRDLTELRSLYLAHNQITHIDRRAFKPLAKLTYLVVKDNQLADVTRLEFTTNFLSFLDMSECGLREIPRGLPGSVRYLQLRRNRIARLSERALEDCPFVTILVLVQCGSVHYRIAQQVKFRRSHISVGQQ